jgi:hypothetical protein
MRMKEGVGRGKKRRKEMVRKEAVMLPRSRVVRKRRRRPLRFPKSFWHGTNAKSVPT